MGLKMVGSEGHKDNSVDESSKKLLKLHSKLIGYNTKD